MLQSLVAAEIAPDLVVGTSVGALNGAWIAGEYSTASVDELADVWTGLHRSDIFPLKLALGLRGFLGRRRSLFDGLALRELLERNIGFERIEDAATPLVVVATDVLTGDDCAFDSGPTVESVLASSAIPGVFPPIEIDGVLYMDGGVSNNAPLSHAINRGADRVFVLPTSYGCPLEEAPSSALGMMLHAISVTVDQQLANDVEHYEGDAEVYVVPTPCPLDVSPTDFSQTEQLIEIARGLTDEWLANRALVPQRS